MQRFYDEHPELAAMFDELQRGIQGNQNLGTTNTLPASLGKDIAYVAAWHYAGPEVIAVGLRMVADAIDPPSVSPTLKEIANIKAIAADTLAGAEARREIAETLGQSMLTPVSWEARLTARNRERGKLNRLGPQGPPPHARG